MSAFQHDLGVFVRFRVVLSDSSFFFFRGYKATLNLSDVRKINLATDISDEISPH